MKRHTDHEGRAESPGPLFDGLDPRTKHLAKYGEAIQLDPERAYDEHLALMRSLPNARCLAIPDFPALERTVRRAREVDASEPRIEVVSPSEYASLRRDLGIARASLGAEHAAPGWEEQALADLRTFARTHQRFAVEDFRAAFPPPPGVNPKALGAVVRRAARERIVVADGYVAVKCSNMSPRVAWKSLVFEGSAKP